MYEELINYLISLVALHFPSVPEEGRPFVVAVFVFLIVYVIIKILGKIRDSFLFRYGNVTVAEIYYRMANNFLIFVFFLGVFIFWLSEQNLL